jgi:hypothetical protein
VPSGVPATQTGSRVSLPPSLVGRLRACLYY